MRGIIYVCERLKLAQECFWKRFKRFLRGNPDSSNPLCPSSVVRFHIYFRSQTWFSSNLFSLTKRCRTFKTFYEVRRAFREMVSINICGEGDKYGSKANVETGKE